MPEPKIKKGKAPKRSEVKEAKQNVAEGGEGSVRIDEIPDAKSYDPAKHANHSHLNP